MRATVSAVLVASVLGTGCVAVETAVCAVRKQRGID